ncbi:murein biosynthesis integral membrane protein MurJ [Actinoplanes sp. TFC3]|uniref:murein biosynthesis integral membrane protein MurJ n=1 Tax=Actinoplanes sp. TFC3 TaxID=1710355 RepID=UPI000831027C|nr:murein biosynthesis integral membrane protein MurJ [Actinoplanes sp. TFC3]
MSGGIYRSVNAVPGDEPDRPDEGTFFVAVDSTATLPTAASDQPLPPEVIPPTPAGTVYGRPAVAEDVEEQPAVKRSTLGNSAVMAAGSLVSRIIGFVRNMLIGMTLGKAIGDPYTSATFLPNQIYELLLGGVLTSVLIPLLVRKRKAEPDGGQLFTQRLLTLAVVSLGAAALIVTVLAPVITVIQADDKAGPAYRDLVTSLSYWILPMIFFTGLSALIGAVLNVRGHFAAPMWAPILNNLVVIATCGAFVLFYGTASGLKPGDMSPGEIALIGGGTLLGMIVQAIGLVPALRKVGFSWSWQWNPRALGLNEVGPLAGWMLLWVAANQIAVSVLARMLSGVGGGDENAGLLAFNNVFLLTMMAHGIIGVSVMTALLPKMSAAADEGRFADVSADLSRGIRLTTTALAPICVIYGVLGVPIAVTLFQGGALKYDQAFATGNVLIIAAFAVIPLSISYLCNYAFYALQGNKTVALINLPVVAVRIAGYFFVAEVMSKSLTAAGMTAANAVSYLLSAVISLSLLRRRIGRLNLGSVGRALIRVIIAAATAAVAGLLVVKILPGGDTPGRIPALLQVIVGGGVIVTSYLVAATLLKVQEVSQVVGMVRRKLGR